MSIVSIVYGVATAVVFSTTLACAAETQPVAWADLVDQSAQTFEDPYQDLSYDQLENLRKIIAETRKIENGELSAEANELSDARIFDAKEMLAEDGIDADWLIAQRWLVAERREKAATAANPELDGQIVTLAGYAIPAPIDADGTTVVYLVPERGMCSHMPPPNANQMIRARVNSDWSPSAMHEPVQLTGKLSIEETNHAFRIVDGDVPMRSSYILEVSHTETMQDLMASTPTTNDWAASIADKLRASGELPSQQRGATE